MPLLCTWFSLLISSLLGAFLVQGLLIGTLVPKFETLELFRRGMLVIGQTIPGKSSLINAFINAFDREASSN